MSDLHPRALAAHEDSGDGGTQVLSREEIRTEEPPLYKVLLLNDDYTTQEFVVMILETIFKKSTSEAVEIMLHVHEKGAGIAGIYTKEIAETKVAIVHQLSRENEFPLKCSMEAA